MNTPSASVAPRYALMAFFCLTFIISCGLWIPVALASHGIITFPLPTTVTGILGAFSLSLAGMIIIAFTEG